MVVTRTRTYAVCPSCGADAGQVDHLLGRVFDTLWYCDACGQRYHLKFSADGDVDITKADGRKVTTVDLLVLRPQDKPVYFTVEGMRFEDGHPDAHTEAEHKAFYYHEHSCPTNWFKPTVVYIDGDDDPHGLFEFVATQDEALFPPDESHGPNARDHALKAFIERHAEPQAPGAVDPVPANSRSPSTRV